MATKPRAVYGRRGGPTKPRTGFSFDFESPVKSSPPSLGNGNGSASASALPRAGTSDDPFDFDETADAPVTSRSALKLPKSPSKRVESGSGSKSAGAASRDSHYDSEESSPPKKAKVISAPTRSASVLPPTKPAKDAWDFDDEEDDVMASLPPKAGSKVAGLKGSTLATANNAAAAAKPPKAPVPPSKAGAKPVAKRPQPPSPPPRDPSPDPDDLDPWEMPNSTSAKQFPSQPTTPVKKARQQTTPKKKTASLSEKLLLSSPVKNDDDYFEVSVPAHVLRPVQGAGSKSPSKSASASAAPAEADLSSDDLEELGSQRSASGSQPQGNSQRSNTSASQRSRVKPSDDPFALLDSPPAGAKRGVAARMKAADGRQIDPLLRTSPSRSPEPASAPKTRTPRKAVAGKSLPAVESVNVNAPAPLAPTNVMEPLDARDAAMQKAIQSMLSVPSHGQAIIGITKMIEGTILAEGEEQSPVDETPVFSNSQPHQVGSFSEKPAGSGSGAARGARTYGRSARAGGMAGAAPQSGAGSAGPSMFGMDLAAVADMGAERRPQAVEEEEEDDDIKSKVASRHELSASGAARMFIDGVEYLLDGIALYQPLSTRRSTAIELVRKIGDSDYVSKLRLHGFVPRILAAFAKDTDAILLACMGTVSCALMSDKRIAEVVAADEDGPVLDILLACLKLDPDPLGAPWGNKTEKAKIRDLKAALATPASAAWTPLGPDPTLRAMAIVALESLISFSRSDGVSSHVGPKGGIPLVCLFLADHEKDRFFALERALRVLERTTMLNPENQAQALGAKGLLEDLVEVVVTASKAGRHGEGLEKQQGVDCHIAALKTLINLSNDDPECARKLGGVDGSIAVLFRNLFAESQKWEAQITLTTGEDHAREYDVVVLIVGLFVNLAGLDPACRDLARGLKMAVACPGTGKCADVCACAKRESALNGLIDVYKRCRVVSFASSEDPDAEERDRNVLLSYISLLVGCLIRDNEANLAVIRPLLPGSNFGTIRKQLEEFAAYQRNIMYTKAESSGQSVENGDQVEKDVLEMVELLRAIDEES